jgi:5,10-methylene-tetrahydrofolate dehydrogenase/methenyl tetrahydrofolate cyclohydrolase
MTTRILSGKALAASILASIKCKTTHLSVKPALTIIRTTERADSDAYIRRKVAMMASLGFPCRVVSAQTEQEIAKCIDAANDDTFTHGILMQLPLANNCMNDRALLDRIDPIKDVDGLHTINVGRLVTGRPYMTPCTPLAVISLLEHYGIPISGQRVAMVGKSMVVGTPLSILFTQRHATTTICHSETKELPDILKSSDIVVAAIGNASYIHGSWLKVGCTVVDVGINRLDIIDSLSGGHALVGDVDFESASKVAAAITPVPGGVGPLTVAMLGSNLVRAYWTLMAGMTATDNIGDHVNQAELRERDS